MVKISFTSSVCAARYAFIFFTNRSGPHSQLMIIQFLPYYDTYTGCKIKQLTAFTFIKSFQSFENKTVKIGLVIYENFSKNLNITNFCTFAFFNNWDFSHSNISKTIYFSLKTILFHDGSWRAIKSLIFLNMRLFFENGKKFSFFSFLNQKIKKYRIPQATNACCKIFPSIKMNQEPNFWSRSIEPWKGVSELTK